MLDGTFWVFVAESPVVPTGLITLIFRTRKFGPENYGIYGLTVSIVMWIEINICALFGGTSVKFVCSAPLRWK